MDFFCTSKDYHGHSLKYQNIICILSCASDHLHCSKQLLLPSLDGRDLEKKSCQIKFKLMILLREIKKNWELSYKKNSLTFSLSE